MTDNAIWQDILKFVKQQLNETAYNVWFVQQMRPLGFKDKVYHIGVQNKFNKNIINNTYAPLIEQALFELGASQPKINFEIIEFPKSEQRDIFDEKEQITPEVIKNSKLNLKYTFSNFVIGSNNQLSHAAAQAVAKAPGDAYNPLFIYGDAGLGKTHLMHAAGHAAIKNFPNLVTEYITTEEFTNDLISGIREDKMNAFRNRYRTIDMLLLDDVQFIANKPQTQEELFHTFNSLYESGKQIILSSDRPPKDIPTLDNRIRSRFEMGLITDIHAPDFETRIAILEQNAEYRGVDVPIEVIEFIAKHVTSNIRELEGALIRVIIHGSMQDEKLTKQMAAKALADVYTQSNDNLTMDDLLALIAKHFDLKPQDILSKGRRKELVIPRQIAMYLIRENTTHSFPEIGQFFSGRDHSTVMYAVQKVAKQIETDYEFADLIRTIKSEII